MTTTNLLFCDGVNDAGDMLLARYSLNFL
ncbi:hypothetical protein M6B38_341490 [Iris pallida]|uniref:Uncharacterized protein n=1 Tax=Iris pallida TaxID=29817 RepID=A0AAX6GXZ9_IRIPA|nr:hypothetical protein M6B38_341490 [Iris pallida]